MARAEAGETATAEVLRDSYLPGDGRLSSEVTGQMVRLFTDLHFLAPIDKVGGIALVYDLSLICILDPPHPQVVKDLANTTNRLYYYNYQHQGSFTLPMAFGFWEVEILRNDKNISVVQIFPRVTA